MRDLKTPLKRRSEHPGGRAEAAIRGVRLPPLVRPKDALVELAPGRLFVDMPSAHVHISKTNNGQARLRQCRLSDSTTNLNSAVLYAVPRTHDDRCLVRG